MDSISFIKEPTGGTSIILTIGANTEDHFFGANYSPHFKIAGGSLKIKINGYDFNVKSPFQVKIDTGTGLGILSYTTPAQAKAALIPLFPKAGGAASLTSAIKSDDTAAFAALTNGQSADFEVGGVISRYSKNAAGTTFKNYNTYP